MPMIQGIDGMALINALRQGREDRYQSDARALDMAGKQMALDTERKRQGVLGNLFAPESPTQGVAGNYASPAPKPSFGQAFGADTEKALASGESLPPMPPASTAPMATAQPGVPKINQAAYTQLSIIDPDTAGKIGSALSKMREDEIKGLRAKNDIMGSTALYLSRVPANQRPAALQQLAPQLMAAGWTEQELRAADISDQGLRGYQAVAIDYDKIIDNDLKEREFRAGKNVALVPGGGVATVAPVMDGTGQITGTKATTVVEPYGGGGDISSDGAASGVQEGATATNPSTGERIQFKGGQWVPMGGGSSNATGGFPSL